MPRGRPPTIDSQSMTEMILKHKNEIICDEENASIVPETHSVWQTMSEELCNKIKPSSLYSYVVNGRFSLKDLLCITNRNASQNQNNSTTSTVDEINQSFCQKNVDLAFYLTFSKTEFDDLILETQRQTKDKKGIRKFRVINILKPQKWTEVMSQKIYEGYRLPHGYHFENSHISQDKLSGGFTGHCQCGSKLKCELLPRSENEQLVRIKCVASAGTADCGKRQCRGDSRRRVASTLEKESTELFRAKKAAKLMNEGDSIEPPHLYSAEVLRTAKYESQQREYRDKNIIHSIAKLKKSGKGQNVVREIGFDPFTVHFWSSHQIRVYNKIMRMGKSFLCIDATGGIGKRVIHLDGGNSQHIFLYLTVLSSPEAQFAACAMLSEHQDTVSIATWLMRWIQSGAEYPKEVVCDSSKALLNACCITFTGYETIECYAKACMSNTVPRSKIGIDVAHYINNWAKSLSLEKKEVKKFYMFCIGQLILCRSQTQATKIIEALLLISKSETAGNGATSLKTAVDLMKEMVTEVTPEMEEILDRSLLDNENENPEIESEVEENEDENLMKKWTDSMKENVDHILNKEAGDDLNPRYSPTFSNRLSKQLPTIPLWSSICRDKFGYGPASSAPVELEFKTLKNQILLTEKRVDVVVESIVNYYDGKLKIVDCASQSNKRRNEGALRNRKHPENMDILSTLPGAAEDITDVSLGKGSYVQKVDILLDTAHESQSVEDFDRSWLQNFDDENKENVDLSSTESGRSSRSDHLPTRSALNEVENWRGLGKETRYKKSYYLTKTNQDLNDIILSVKTRKLPILKNGNDPKLGLFFFGSAKFSVANTCPVDSIFQILLAAVTDNVKILNYIKIIQTTNPIFEMVLDVAEGKIQQTTYRKRLQIYLDYLNKKPVPNSMQSIQGACNVVSLANFLFKNCASFEEKSTCQAGCSPQSKYLPTVTITEREIRKPLGEVLKEHLILPGVKCRAERCDGMQTNEIQRIGDIAVIGVDMDNPTELGSFAKSYVCPKTGEIYKILGVVEYRGPSVKRRSKEDIGHYIAITRRYASWVAYDDGKKIVPCS